MSECCSGDDEKMQINNRTIDQFHLPYVIADISGNHEQDYTKACLLIKSAKDAGCDAVKFQTYLPNDLTLPNLGTFKGRDLYELYDSIFMPHFWYPELFKYAKELGITAFTTIFNPIDVEWLEKLGCPAYKISSYEINYIDLLDAVKSTNKLLWCLRDVLQGYRTWFLWLTESRY